MAQRGFSLSISDRLSSRQATAFAQWIGGANVLRNYKVREYRDLLAQGRGAEINQAYAPIKQDPDVAFLKDIPVQILRNAASSAYTDAEAARKGVSRFPKVKGRNKKRSCIITQELFDLQPVANDKTQVTIYDSATRKRTKLFSITLPYSSASLSKQFIISRQGRSFSFSGSLDDGQTYPDNEALLNDVAYLDDDKLLGYITGLDGGVARPLQACNGTIFDYTPEEKRQLRRHNDRIKRLQAALSGKKRRNGNKSRRCESNNQRHLANQIATLHGKIRRLRRNFAHRVSRNVVETSGEIICVEDLKLKAMTRRAKKKTQGRQTLKNGARAKSGLNRSLSNVGLGQIYTLIKYKANARNKGFLKINPAYTSQECHACGSRNTARPTQAGFHCLACGLKANADENAARNSAKRGVRDIKSGAFAAKAKPRKTIARRRKKHLESDLPLVGERPSGKKSERREDGLASLAASHVSMVETSGISPETSGSLHLSHAEAATLSTTKVDPSG
ncbi:RNA-guided endonuclease InsQ/TnpB family protein [Vreelandella rituensis]|nr:transposase [Halomonas rituensis]